MNARQKIDKLIIDHQKEFGFHSNFDFMNELLAEMEEERDEFVLGFASYLIALLPKVPTNIASALEQYKTAITQPQATS